MGTPGVWEPWALQLAVEGRKPCRIEPLNLWNLMLTIGSVRDLEKWCWKRHKVFGV